MAEKKITEISRQFSDSLAFKTTNPTVFCAGSLGRGDIGGKSDLDSFIISDREVKRLEKYRLYAAVGRIHENLKFPAPSNDGEFLKVYELDDMKAKTGEPKDDSENLFTVRMLLLLESRPLFNTPLYDQCIRDIISHYFRDSRDGANFKPIFIINDFLRYWRTLCLNYERLRDGEKPWRKKNVNLKFSRMLTIFGTVLPIIVKDLSSTDELIALSNKTPLERLVEGLDGLNDERLAEDFKTFLEHYEQFLKWKDDPQIEKKLASIKDEINQAAQQFSGFLYRALNHPNIDADYRRMLVL